MKIRNLAILICLLAALTVSGATSAFAVSLQASSPSQIVFSPVVGGLTEPTFATHAGDGSGRLFIVQQTGEILILKGTTLNPSPFLDVSSIITAGGEQGLLGLAFDPNYATNGYFYIVYSNKTGVGDDVLARYHVSANPDVADPSSRQILLTVTEPYTNHNGGMIAFGPDGYLYLGLGDGGSGGDPQGNGQNTSTLLGKILRLDVDSTPDVGLQYKIPPTNPFYGSSDPNVKKEIWAYGLRNPWRFSFDKSTGDLYIGDVGQDAQEEIDYQPSSSTGGENYGWNWREGNLCYSTCTLPPGYVPPVTVYDHGTNDSIGCAVTGGYVYRGAAFPDLVGVYLFGDFCSGRLWGLVRDASSQWVQTFITSTSYNISSFAEDEQGELYILDYGGGQLIRVIVPSFVVFLPFVSR